ncbi:TrmH family RNA methyltransferase [Bacilliculturomica massiliensis]|uniref:TrmH family RNA methyltransferase n=1 Tax=Bacilliculturomica massiliensis TaxID=1917867 RepID=UPI00103243FB|nr:RNA methyltransferase [Bacilliculturomica massiliensis]
MNLREISSPDNSKVKNFAALTRKKQRDKQGRYIIEGPNLLMEALKNGVDPELVLFRRSAFSGRESRCGPGELPAGLRNTGEYRDLLDLLERGGAEGGPKTRPEVLLLADGLFDRLGQTDTPQGVMAVVKKRTWTEEELFGRSSAPCGRRSNGNILVLDRLQDPGNLGTALRTADGAGFSGALLLSGCGDIYSPKVVRACAGTLFRLPVYFCGTPGQALELLHRNHKKVYATALNGSRLYYECDLKSELALVIGNEGNGVCAEFLEEADGLLSIPMAGNLESLNAAVAAGILMYETVRQRNGG